MTILTRSLSDSNAVWGVRKQPLPASFGQRNLFVVNDLLIAKGSPDKITQAESLNHIRLATFCSNRAASCNFGERKCVRLLSEQPQEGCLPNEHSSRLSIAQR